MGTLSELTYFVMVKLDFKNTMPKTHIYYMFAFILLGLFYHSILKDYISKKKLVAIIVTFELYAILNAVFIQSIFKYPTWPRAFLSLVFLLASIIYFHKTMMEARIKNLRSEPLIWINTAVLIYYAGSLFYSILFNLILEYSTDYAKLIVNYFGILNALFYMLITVGFWKAGKLVRSNS